MRIKILIYYDPDELKLHPAERKIKAASLAHITHSIQLSASALKIQKAVLYNKCIYHHLDDHFASHKCTFFKPCVCTHKKTPIHESL